MFVCAYISGGFSYYFMYIQVKASIAIKIKKESLNNLTLSLESNILYKNNFCPEYIWMCIDIQRYYKVNFMECIDTQFLGG